MRQGYRLKQHPAASAAVRRAEPSLSTARATTTLPAPPRVGLCRERRAVDLPFAGYFGENAAPAGIADVARASRGGRFRRHGGLRRRRLAAATAGSLVPAARGLGFRPASRRGSLRAGLAGDNPREAATHPLYGLLAAAPFHHVWLRPRAKWAKGWAHPPTPTYLVPISGRSHTPCLTPSATIVRHGVPDLRPRHHGRPTERAISNTSAMIASAVGQRPAPLPRKCSVAPAPSTRSRPRSPPLARRPRDRWRGADRRNRGHRLAAE